MDIRIDKTSWFSESYAIARGRFRKAARRAGGRLSSLALSAKGPRNGDLSVDIAWFGSKSPRRVLVHSSGLHGVEAFSGSAIQLRWLKTQVAKLREHDAIVLAHALNPYGMAWRRRFNENNVDLNRNFREPGNFTSLPGPGWEAVDALVNPPAPPGREWFLPRVLWLLLRYGGTKLRQTVAGGQCLNPKGLFYGGRELEEGPAKYQDFIRTRLAGAERIVVVDVHTGLGFYGQDRLLVDAASGREGASQTMRAAFGSMVEPITAAGTAYEVRGAQQEMYFRLFPEASVFFATQEFGTYSPMRVLRALRNENRVHFYGDSRRRVRRNPTKVEILEVFNPADEKWRNAVLARGLEVLRQAAALAFSSD